MIFLILTFRLASLDYPSLSDPSESRYATMGLEMLQHGDWVTPFTYKDGERVPFLGKPPLHSWLTALSFKYFGISEFSARVPSFLSLFLISGLLYYFTLRFFNKELALCTFLFLPSTAVYFFLNGSCLTDPVLCFCITLSYVSFAFAFIKERNRFWELIFFISLGLGMLTKGPVSLIIPGIGIFCWLIYERRFFEIKKVNLLQGILVFLLIWVPWYVYEEIRNPGFLKYFFINENLLRYLVKDYGDRYGTGHTYPYGTIWLFFFLATLPWNFFILTAPLKKKFYQDIKTKSGSQGSYVFFWMLSSVLLFTVGKQISISYILPSVVPASLVFSLIFLHTSKTRRFYLNTYMLAGILIFTTILSLFFLLYGLVAGEELQTIKFSSSIYLIFTLLILYYYKHKRYDFWKLLSLSTASLTLCYAIIMLSIDDRIDDASSAKSLAFVLKHEYPDISNVAFFNKLPISIYFYTADNHKKYKFKEVSEERIDLFDSEILVTSKKNLNKLDQTGFKVLREVNKWVILIPLAQQNLEN